MSFLEDLENNNSENKQEKDKQPRELWESCFKYFQHFTTIIQKKEQTFDSEFNFVFLNLKKPCLISGPYEIKRSHNDSELKFEITMSTQFNKAIKVNRKDNRSAELLHLKLLKDGVQSTVKSQNNQFFIELSHSIKSIFSLALKNNSDFFIEYTNVLSSTKRSIKLNIKNINEAYMDKIAKYIVGQDPSLYTESISDQEITKIREKIQLDKKRIAEIDAKVQAEIKEQKKLEQIKHDNTLKEKSKRYLKSQSIKLKDKVTDSIRKIFDK
jgi:hypothetical protein